MITLYQRTKELFDIAGNSVGWETKPVTFPDTFFLWSGLQFNWTDNTVTRNKKTYYLDKLVVNQAMDIPSIDEWKSHYGNDIKYEYYTGDASETERNPSGNTKNTKRAIYLSSNITKYILEFDYNENNQVVKISSLAPQDSISSGIEQPEEDESAEYTEQNLNSLFCAVGNEILTTDQNKVLMRGNGKCIVVTRRRTNNPVLSDCIQTESDTGKITISISSPLYDVQVFAYRENGDIVYTSDRKTAIQNQPATFEIINNYAHNIDVLGITLYYQDEEALTAPADETQENLGLSVDFTKTINLIIRSEGSEDITRKVLVGDTIAYNSLPTLARNNYEFDGWSIDGNIVDSDFMVTANTLVQAIWTRLYTLTKINDGAQSTQSYREGTSVTLETPEKAGHTFVGWSADGVTIYSSTFEITEDLTLTALYTVNQYTLTLINGESETTETYDYGTSVTLSTPEKENYSFDGWFAEGATEPTASPLTITENTTLTAQFTIIQYTVTLINVDGRGLNTQDTIVCDSGHSLLESEVKAKLDESLNTFEGCYTDSEFTEAVTLPLTITNNVTLYCKFQEIGG